MSDVEQEEQKIVSVVGVGVPGAFKISNKFV
jgi:hypothetical protein